MKKCLFVVTGLEQGGIETYLLRFLRFNAGSSYNIVWCKSGTTGALYEAYKKITDEIILLPLGYFSLMEYVRLYRYLRSNHVDTICDFTGNFAGIPLMFSFFAGVKKRIAFYRSSTNHFKETPFRLFYNYVVKKMVCIFSTKILSNSFAALDFFFPNWKNNPVSYKVIYNEVVASFASTVNDLRKEVRAKLGIPQYAFVIGHVGRYNVAKNHRTIIDVANHLCHKYLDVFFVLVGKDTDTCLSEIVQSMGLSSQIKLLGYRNNVQDLLASFDIFYFPSLTEGQPNALIEAMVSGLPILASDIMPIKETVPERMYTGLVPATDVEVACDRLESCYLNRDLLKKMTCKDWAVKTYCSNKWFKMFQNELF